MLGDVNIEAPDDPARENINLSPEGGASREVALHLSGRHRVGDIVKSWVDPGSRKPSILIDIRAHACTSAMAVSNGALHTGAASSETSAPSP